MATVTYDTVTGELTWNVTYSSLSSPINGAHFHGPTPAGFDAPITVTMAAGPSPIVGSATLSPTHAGQLLAGQWYINIHSDNFGGGEIRGQVAPVRWDFNGDGRADILWRHSSSGENYLYTMDGTAILPDEGYLRTAADQNWRVVGVGDFNIDGTADILWRNIVTGENYIYLMNGPAIVGEGYIRTVADQNWQVAGVGDFNGDLRADILWRNAITGENYIYIMDGLTILGTEGYIRTVADPSWHIVAVGDFNGDGKSDILWRNSFFGPGANYIYFMDGLTIADEGSTNWVDYDWQLVGAADFDGDGRADILWRNTSTGENYMFPMAGRTARPTAGYLPTVPDLAWRMVALGDFNGDGRADILWRNASTGENYVYLMNGRSISEQGYLRTVSDQSWRVQYPATRPEAVVTLGPVADNTMYEDQPEHSNGAGEHFYAGPTASDNVRRALLKFDVAGNIPPGSTIRRVTLTLRATGGGPTDGSYGLYRVLADWGEGTSNATSTGEGTGAPATLGDVTWLRRFFGEPSSSWSNLGGDFAASEIPPGHGFAGTGSFDWIGSDLTLHVQQWLNDPATQFGWLLRSFNESLSGSVKEFASKEHPNVAFRPRLEVRFLAP
jgi:hypothetical protein